MTSPEPKLAASRPAAQHAASLPRDSRHEPAGAPVSGQDIRSRLRLRETWRLLKPYWVSPEGRGGLGLLGLVVALNLLIGLSFQQEQREADFRYALMRLRENAEGVALYGGEPAESAGLLGRFGSIRDNWGWLMRYTRRLVLVSSGYGQIAIVFPLIVAAPRYFARQLTLGGLMQISSAFGQVQGALSWLVDSYASLVNWQAASNRVLDFQAAIRAADADRVQADGEHGIRVREQGERSVSLRDPGERGTRPRERGDVGAVRPGMVADGLVLAVPEAVRASARHPDGADPIPTTGFVTHRPTREFTSPFSLTIERGQRWLVTGPSGSAKSLFFRAMAGIWTYGRGTVERPAHARTLFLPQKSYLPTGTLADALCYPSRADRHDKTTLQEVLRATRLDGLQDRLDDVANWSTTLSPGEQQRLAFARALLQAPDFLFLDEATSALDEDTEAAMYALIRERLPDAALVSIAHRSTVARWHDRFMRSEARKGSDTTIRTGWLGEPGSPATPAASPS